MAVDDVMSPQMRQLTSRAAVNDVMIVPADMAGLIVCDDFLVRQAEVCLAGALGCKSNPSAA